MSLYICRQCASTARQHALRAVTYQARRLRIAAQSETAPRMDMDPIPLSLLGLLPRRARKGTRSLSSSTATRRITLDDFLTPPSTSSPTTPSVHTPASIQTPTPAPVPAPVSAPAPVRPPQTRRPPPPLQIQQQQQRAEREKIRLRIFDTKQQIDRYAKSGQVDQLYLEFWRICATEPIQTQYLIWRRTQSQYETIYRAFNTPAKPSLTVRTAVQEAWTTQGYPVSLDPLQITVDPVLLDSVKPKKKGSSSASSTHPKLAPPYPTSTSVSLPTLVQPSDVPFNNSSTLDNKISIFTLQFIARSHQHRLFQMHQYFETVLGLQIGYYSRVALLTAFATSGDMITANSLFRQWEASAGKEMYSTMIRGLIGQHSPSASLSKSLHVHDSLSRHPITGLRNRGVTQVNAALELFYELQRRGGTPTFEIYHSLVVGLATYKNNMEAAEMLLEHMIIQKGKPYVQVLHVMIREYTRRRDLESAERIFDLLTTYGIRPKAMTCNMMLGAIFRMSPMDADTYLGQTSLETLQTFHQQSTGEDQSSDQTNLSTTSLSTLIRMKVDEIRKYMRTSGIAPDEATFSTLIYGYGHLEGGYQDLKATMRDLAQSDLEPNLAILNSLIFAHLNHGQLSMAESILDKMLKSFHPLTDSMVKMKRIRRREQKPSPFRKSRMLSKEEDDEGDEEKDISEEDSPARSTTSAEKLPAFAQELKRRLQQWHMFPGKGTFHALMIGYVEQGDIRGMERIVDKMIMAQRQQREQREHHAQTRRALAELLSSQQQHTNSNWLYRAETPILRNTDLEADEYTANIMLLGYLTERNLEKAELIHQRIQAREDWQSRSGLFEGREVSRRALIEFVKNKRSKAVVQRALSRVPEGEEGVEGTIEEEEVVPRSQKNDPHQTLPPSTEKDPVEDLKEELDDDIEIDVTTLSAKLRGLMSSTRTFT